MRQRPAILPVGMPAPSDLATGIALTMPAKGVRETPGLVA